MSPRPPSSTLFPYTTLFRSGVEHRIALGVGRLRRVEDVLLFAEIDLRLLPRHLEMKYRSEEHTSELQSHSDLVCRLLLEKKKKTQNKTDTPNRPQNDT